MQRKRISVILGSAGILLVAACAVALALPGSARAQCGSQASSCKNCHEVQGKDPVNADGTVWHQSHAFGDFCYICHGGNNQATDETAAHAGMVPPLSDVQAACQQCHPNDLQARALVYAKVLNVEVGSPAAPAPAATTAPAAQVPAPAAQSAGAEAPMPAGKGVLVDYVQNYDEQVLGQAKPNVGNTILVVMIIAMLLGGGALIITREHLVRVSFKETRPVQGEYPPDVVDMVPDLAKLKPTARRSLRRVLQKPSAAAALLDAVDQLKVDAPDQE